MDVIQAQPAMQTTAPTVLVERPGKSGQSVGHLAKQAVAAARDAGVDLPRNAQGAAASQIAHGADPASIFAALAAPVDPGETGETVPADETQTATDSYQENADVLSANTADAAETALALLMADDQET